VLGHHVEQRVDGGLHAAAGRIRLDRRAFHLPVRAQVRHQRAGVGRSAAIEPEEPAPRRFEQLARAGETGAGEQCAVQPGLGGPAHVHPLGHGAVAEEGPGAAGERASQADRVAELAGVEPEGPAGGDRGSECAAHAGGVPALLVELVVAAQCALHPPGDVVAENDRLDPGTAVDRGGAQRGGGEQRGHHNGAGVVAATGVVQLEGMGGHAVAERGGQRRRGGRRTPQPRAAG
jgi:hypothetical protein